MIEIIVMLGLYLIGIIVLLFIAVPVILIIVLQNNKNKQEAKQEEIRKEIRENKERQKEESLRNDDKCIPAIEEFLSKKYGKGVDFEWKLTDESENDVLIYNKGYKSFRIIATIPSNPEHEKKDFLDIALEYDQRNDRYRVTRLTSSLDMQKRYKKAAKSLEWFRDELFDAVQKTSKYLLSMTNLSTVEEYDPEGHKDFLGFIRMTNDEAYGRYVSSYGITQTGEPLGISEFAIDGVDKALMEQEQLRIMAAIVGLKEILEVNLAMLHDKGCDDIVKEYFGKDDRYTLPWLKNKKDLNDISSILEKLLRFARTLEYDQFILQEAFSDYHAIIKGKNGEMKVEERLKSFLNQGCEIYPGMILPIIDPKTEHEKKVQEFESDFIVVTDKTISVLEVKNYSAGKITVSKDGRMKHFAKRGSEIYEDRNAIEQCEEHVTYLTRLLERETGCSYAREVRGMIVISNDDMEIENESDYPIIRMSLLRNQILKDGNTEDLDVDLITDILDRNSKAAHKYSFYDYRLELSRENYEELANCINPILNAIADRSWADSNNRLMRYDPYWETGDDERGEGSNGNKDLFITTGNAYIYAGHRSDKTYNEREEFRNNIEMGERWSEALKYFVENFSNDKNKTGKQGRK